jgi:CheY-like chemotaxis protein
VARILVVDDEPDVRELFNITLKMAGHETDTAKHGLEAIERLATESPDLIVLDLMMPHLDGFTFLARVRDEMATKPMRVLVATAKVLEDADQEKLGDWPVVGVLNKGELDIGQMVTVVTTALSKDPLKKGAETAAEPEKEKAAAEAAPAKSAEAAGKPAPKPEPSTPPAQPAAQPQTSVSPAPTASVPSTPADKPAEKAAEASDKPAAPDVKKDAAASEQVKSKDQKELSTKPLKEDKGTQKPQPEAKEDAAGKPAAPKSAP